MDGGVLERRWSRAQQNLQDRGLDGLLVTEKYNYWYLTGHQSREFDKKMRPMLFFLPSKGEPALVLYAQAKRAAQAVCPVENVYTYEDVPFPPELVAQLIDDYGLRESRIGMEYDQYERLGLSYTQLQSMMATLPSTRFVDAGSLMQDLRSSKGPEEIALVQRACDLSLEAWQEALTQFRLGMTNDEIERLVAKELAVAGTDVNMVGHVTAGNGVAGRDGYRAGDIVWCDFGGTFGGYQGDVARRAVFGDPTKEQLAYQRDIAEVLEAEIAAIRPGVRAADVAAAASSRLEELGYAGLGPKKRVGHGLGLAASEVPSLSLADDTVLRPGMLLTPEPRFNLPSGERVHIEEVVVVTEDGARKLTTGAEVLDVVPVGVRS